MFPPFSDNLESCFGPFDIAKDSLSYLFLKVVQKNYFPTMYGYCLYILESVFILMNPSREISKTGINSLIASMIISIKMNTWLIPSVPIGWLKIPPMVLHDDSKTNHQWLHDLYYLYICINVYYQEQFEDTKWVIRSRKSKNDRRCPGQNKKDKRTNNYLQHNTHNTTYWGNQRHLKSCGKGKYLLFHKWHTSRYTR